MAFDDDVSMCPLSLSFHDSRREQAFISTRHRKLTSRVVWGSMILLVYLMLTPGFFFGGLYILAPPGRWIERLRVQLVGVIALVALAWMTVSCTRLRNMTGARGFELGSAAVAVLIMVLIPVQDPWYLVKVCGGDPQALIVAHSSDYEVLLYLDIWLTGLHFMLPLRWRVLLLVEVTCLLCYIVPTVFLGSRVGPLYAVANAICLTLLILIAAVGKRDLEAFERTSFVQLAQERALRAQAENKLHSAVEMDKKGAEHEDASVPDTTPTGKIFGEFGEPGANSVKEQLEQMQELGTREHWLIKGTDLRLHFNRILGSGSFGYVVAASYYGARAVAKVPSSKHEPNQKALAAMAQELRIFRRLHHPNIVLFYGACINPNSFSMLLVLEYVQGVELGTAVRGPSLDPAELLFRLNLVNDVCCALYYLHTQRPAIIHGDIKDSNVLVERRGLHSKAKLLDFGLSQLLTPSAKKLGGTLRWMAPEVMARQQQSLSLNADTFSLGRLIYMVTMGEQPLREVSEEEIWAKVRAGSCHSLVWPDNALLLRQTKELVEACTAVDPSERPGIEQIQAMLRGWGAESVELSAIISQAFVPEEPIGDCASLYSPPLDARLAPGSEMECCAGSSYMDGDEGRRDARLASVSEMECCVGTRSKHGDEGQRDARLVLEHRGLQL